MILAIECKNPRTLEFLKFFFEAVSSFSIDEQQSNDLIIEVADQNDANATETAIEQELQENLAFASSWIDYSYYSL